MGRQDLGSKSSLSAQRLNRPLGRVRGAGERRKSVAGKLEDVGGRRGELVSSRELGDSSWVPAVDSWEVEGREWRV